MRINICELDRKVCPRETSLNKAMRIIAEYIKKDIDPTFPIIKFEEWLEFDDDKPFKHGKNTYYWGNNDVQEG